MQSVVLITDSDFNFAEIIKHWNNLSLSLSTLQNRIVIEFDEGRIYIDLIEEGLNEYEPYELENIDIEHPRFYSVSFSDQLAIRRFIKESLLIYSSFFIDDDKGNITKIKDLTIDSF
jgi:hypothetical protein